MGCGASAEGDGSTAQRADERKTGATTSTLESSMVGAGSRDKDGRIKHTTLYPEEARVTDVIGDNNNKTEADQDDNRGGGSPQPPPSAGPAAVTLASPVEPTQHSAASSLRPDYHPTSIPTSTTTNTPMVIEPSTAPPPPMLMQPSALLQQQQPSHQGDYSSGSNNLSSTSFSVQGTQSSVFAAQSPNVNHGNSISPLHPGQAPPVMAPLGTSPSSAPAGVYHQSSSSAPQPQHQAPPPDTSVQLQPLGGVNNSLVASSGPPNTTNAGFSGVYHTGPPQPSSQPSVTVSTPAPAPTLPEKAPAPPPEEKKGFFGSIGDKLSSAKNSVTTSISNVLPGAAKRRLSTSVINRNSLYLNTMDKLVFLLIDNHLRQIPSDEVFKALFVGSGLSDTEGMQTFSAGAGGVGGVPPYPVGLPLSASTCLLVINQTPQQFYLVDEPHPGAGAVVRHLASSTISKLGFDPSLARATTAQEMQMSYQVGSPVI